MPGLRRSRIKICAGVFVCSMLLQSGCGTIFYPKRRGQTSGRIDPTVAILNGLGLLLFLLPGIIAFAIDFSTGAIYLPPGEEGGIGSTIHLHPDEMTPERLAEVIREHTGVEVSLTETNLRVMSVDDADSVGERLNELQSANSR